MKIIKVDTDLNISTHDFPTGDHNSQNEYLRMLIGNECRIYEHVMPRRLFTELHMPNWPTKSPGHCVSMLIDEEGRLKENTPNIIGSYLYEMDLHGNPIMGNVLFVGEMWSKGGVEFCGICDALFTSLKEQLEFMVSKAKEGMSK